MSDHDEKMHPIRARSGGTCLRFDLGDDETPVDTIGWQNIPQVGDAVRKNGDLYRVQRRIFDADEPDCIVLQLLPAGDW